MGIVVMAALVLFPGASHSAPPVISCSISSATLSFGALDPSAAVTIAAIPATIQIVCTRSVGAGQINFTITETRSPSYNVAPVGYKLQHLGAPSTEYVPYALTFLAGGSPIVFPYSDRASNGVPYVIDVNGSVQGLDYIDAYWGNYADAITLTIAP